MAASAPSTKIFKSNCYIQDEITGRFLAVVPTIQNRPQRNKIKEMAAHPGTQPEFTEAKIDYIFDSEANKFVAVNTTSTNSLLIESGQLIAELRRDILLIKIALVAKNAFTFKNPLAFTKAMQPKSSPVKNEILVSATPGLKIIISEEVAVTAKPCISLSGKEIVPLKATDRVIESRKLRMLISDADQSLIEAFKRTLGTYPFEELGYIGSFPLNRVITTPFAMAARAVAITTSTIAAPPKVPNKLRSGGGSIIASRPASDADNYSMSEASGSPLPSI